MIMRAAAGVVALLMAIAVVCTGVVYLGAAIDTALVNELGVPGAAALTAFILLIVPLVWCLSVLLRKPRKPPARALGEEALGLLLGALAKDTSLVALAGAGLFGIVEAFFKSRRKKPADKK
jgi:NhaP-type Na+/H+ or K+/H+ antiporter